MNSVSLCKAQSPTLIVLQQADQLLWHQYGHYAIRYPTRHYHCRFRPGKLTIKSQLKEDSTGSRNGCYQWWYL